MSSAQYQITHRLTETGTPLMVMTVRVEHEVLLGTDDLSKLYQAVQDVGGPRDGEGRPQRLSDVELKIWLEEVRRIEAIKNEIDGMPKWSLFSLNSGWNSIPKAMVEEILRVYAATKEQAFTTYVAGSYPNFEVAINWGITSIRALVAPGEVKSAREDLHLLAGEVSQMGGLTDQELKEAWEVLRQGQKIATNIGKCAAGIGIAVGGEAAGLVIAGALIGACLDAVEGVAALADAEEKRREDRRLAMEKEMSAKRGPKEVKAGIDRSGELERGEMIGRTC